MNLHGLNFSTTVNGRDKDLFFYLNNMIMKSSRGGNQFIINLYISSRKENDDLDKEICGVLLSADEAREIGKQLILLAEIIDKEGEVLP